MVAHGTDELVALDIGNAAIVKGPLEQGCASEGPYDVVLIEGAIEQIPSAIVDQLKEGGRLVSVQGIGRAGSAMTYTKLDGELRGAPAFNCSVAPLPGFQKEAAFVF